MDELIANSDYSQMGQSLRTNLVADLWSHLLSVGIGPDQFLARVIAVLGDTATFEGGLVLELRLEGAGTTKDVDLRLVGASADVLAKPRNLISFLRFGGWRATHKVELQHGQLATAQETDSCR